MTFTNQEEHEYSQSPNSVYLVDIPEIEKEGGNIPIAALTKELKEYVLAVSEKSALANKAQKYDLVPILDTIATDMRRIISYYETNDLSFNKCYEEIVSLYVFVEIYFKFEDKR